MEGFAAASTRVLGTERGRIIVLAAFIVALYVVAIGLLVVYGPAHWALLSTATLAYTLGLRHAFDADHIAAIDNTTRQLRHRGHRSVGVGFFFSLGHSSVVVALTLVAALVSHAVPDLGGSTRFVGSGVSGGFLWIIGMLNLAVLLDVVRVWRRIRNGHCDESELAQMLAPRGLLMRLGLDRVLRFVSRSSHMYPVGLLFGLGFETATEVALIALGASAAATGVPLLAVLSLPLLFTAGMSTMDTIDGVVMLHAYDWALRRPVRKVFYNLTITSLSVAVALIVGTVQLLNAAIEAFHLRGGFWTWIAGLDFQVLGYAMAGLFVGTWLLAMTLWRLLDIEQRWKTLQPADTG
jgi:high-affinity nickel-transport protein